jgi:mannitol/fructose-specific phosphotransferase system IIA component (Ntr-type)
LILPRSAIVQKPLFGETHRQTPNAEPRTPNAERQTPNAKRYTPNANRLTARMRRAILLGRTLGEEKLINTKTLESLRTAAFVNPLAAGSEIEAIDRLLEELKANPLVTDLAELRRAIIERQKVDPPFLPMGVAFPHARTDSVRGIVIVVGISPQPIPFSAGSAKLVLLIGVPKKAIAEYLELTSFLARHLRGENVLDRLMGTTNIEQFLAAFAP